MPTSYLYAGWGQKTGADLTRSVGLPGGGDVVVPRPGWARPGVPHRDDDVWDPFGQPVDPATFAIGTTASDDTGQVAGNTLWHQGALKPAESAGSALVVEMGVRLYVPALGRLLQVDPIESGGTNDYVWASDPIGQSDLSGKCFLVWCSVGDAVDDISGVLGVAAMFGCLVCGAVSAVLSIGSGIVKVANGDAGGWLDIAAGATFGTGKAVSAVSRSVELTLKGMYQMPIRTF